MVTTRSDRRTSNQQELSVIFSNLSLSTSIQGLPQKIMVAPEDGLQDPYLEIIDIYISEHLKIYNKAIFGLTESYRYDITRSKWNGFYQELDDAVSTFQFKAAVLILEAIYAHNALTEVKDIIQS